MFATVEGTVDQALEREREACWRELGTIREERARLAHRETLLVRAANDRGDWKAAGYASSAQWFAQVSKSDYRSAERITSTSDALRNLPALDQAMSTGALTLDQVAAAAQYATPATDAELARVAVGKAPSQITVTARTLAPPKVEDDRELYRRRALSMTWVGGKARARDQRPAAARARPGLRGGDLEHRQVPARRRQAGRGRARMAAIRRRRARRACAARRHEPGIEAQCNDADRALER